MAPGAPTLGAPQRSRGTPRLSRAPREPTRPSGADIARRSLALDDERKGGHHPHQADDLGVAETVLEEPGHQEARHRGQAPGHERAVVRPGRRQPGVDARGPDEEGDPDGTPRGQAQRGRARRRSARSCCGGGSSPGAAPPGPCRPDTRSSPRRGRDRGAARPPACARPPSRSRTARSRVGLAGSNIETILARSGDGTRSTRATSAAAPATRSQRRLSSTSTASTAPSPSQAFRTYVRPRATRAKPLWMAGRRRSVPRTTAPRSRARATTRLPPRVM